MKKYIFLLHEEQSAQIIEAPSKIEAERKFKEVYTTITNYSIREEK